MISYDPLFQTMSQKNITSYALFKKGLSKATYYSIKKGNSIANHHSVVKFSPFTQSMISLSASDTLLREIARPSEMTVAFGCNSDIV